LPGVKRRPRPELPVDLERLRTQFPSLTDDDLEAYAAVTRRVLADPGTRARRMAEVMERARQASAKAAAGASLGHEEALLVRYRQAMAKMQATTVKRG